MAKRPVSIRFDDHLSMLLAEGCRRTPLKRADLVRRTLRLHLRQVIEAEAAEQRPITNVKPLPKGALAKAYRQEAKEGWDKVEAAAVAAQARPGMED
jgi:hypothetical protein